MVPRSDEGWGAYMEKTLASDPFGNVRHNPKFLSIFTFNLLPPQFLNIFTFLSIVTPKIEFVIGLGEYHLALYAK